MGTTFSPGEIEKIAGISSVKQRDLRRRGILASKEAEGHTRYSLQDLGFFMALNALTQQNVPVSHAAEMATRVANKIARLAIEYWTIYVKHADVQAAPPLPNFHCFYRDDKSQLHDLEASDISETLDAHSRQKDVLIAALVVLDTRYLAALILEKANRPLTRD